MFSFSSAIFYNLPKLPPNSSWNPNSKIIATVATVGDYPRSLFVDRNNILYVASQSCNAVKIWYDSATSLSKTLHHTNSRPWSVFAVDHREIYVNNQNQGQVEIWSLDTKENVAVMSVPEKCYGLFVDQNNSIYCALADQHRVIRATKTDDSFSSPVTIAGNGVAGRASNQLNIPRGIFVDKNFHLYVADYENNRIQLFRQGQSNAKTVLGRGSTSSISLNGPNDVVLDADGNLFVVEYNAHRVIMGGGPQGFRCIIGCSGSKGSQNDKLNNPTQLSFDRQGNLYVTNQGSNQVQKFCLTTNKDYGKYEKDEFDRTVRIMLIYRRGSIHSPTHPPLEFIDDGSNDSQIDTDICRNNS